MFNENRPAILQGIGVGFLLLIFAMIIFYFYQKKKQNTSKPVNLKTMIEHQTLILEDISAVLGQRMNHTNTVEGFFDSSGGSIPTMTDNSGGSMPFFHNTVDNSGGYVPPKNTTDSQWSKGGVLLNIQPVTVKESGFIGPVSSGAYEEAVFVKNVLKSGIRSFVLHIDQYTGTAKDKSTFAGPGEPCFLHRNDSGGLVSINSGSILKFSTALAENAFSGTVPLSTDPILLILHGESAPDPVTKPKDYLAFYSKVAEQLNPLIPFHLGLTPLGDYHRQGREDELFITPFKSFEKKIIVVSTIDTTLFRNVSRLNMAAYSPYKDLDFWVHARLLHTSLPKSSSGRYLTMDDLQTLSVDQTFKGYFVIVLPGKMKNLSDNEMKKLLSMGVNVIPLDIVTPDVNDTVVTLKMWNTKTWNLKAVALQT